MEELLDVLDENGIKTGEILPRKEIHKKGLWHRVVVIAIINEKNEILMQQRSFHKDKNAGMWDISVAGHISTSQDAVEAALREINEEVGINIPYAMDMKDFRYMFSYRKEQTFSEEYIDRQFFDFFIFRKEDLRIEDIKIQESEVEQVKLVSIRELNQMLENEEVVERDAVYRELLHYLFRV